MGPLPFITDGQDVKRNHGSPADQGTGMLASTQGVSTRVRAAESIPQSTDLEGDVSRSRNSIYFLVVEQEWLGPNMPTGLSVSQHGVTDADAVSTGEGTTEQAKRVVRLPPTRLPRGRA